MEKGLFSSTPIFETFSEERKAATYKVDTFNLTRKYLEGGVSFEMLRKHLKSFGKSGVVSHNYLIEYSRSIATHEAYKSSMGKSDKERIGIRHRLRNLLNELR